MVRLKGGDPFIFGRGGEELEALAAAQIDFSVIPGITAAAGCAAYAGIPLTHRDHAHSVSFVTGHADAMGNEPDWRALAAPGHTVVFYMGLAQLPHIVTQLRAHGAPAQRPAALIANGTRPDQQVVTAVLDTLSEAAARAGLASPVLLVVGEVVGCIRASPGSARRAERSLALGLTVGRAPRRPERQRGAGEQAQPAERVADNVPPPLAPSGRPAVSTRKLSAVRVLATGRP